MLECCSIRARMAMLLAPQSPQLPPPTKRRNSLTQARRPRPAPPLPVPPHQPQHLRHPGSPSPRSSPCHAPPQCYLQRTSMELASRTEDTPHLRPNRLPRRPLPRPPPRAPPFRHPQPLHRSNLARRSPHQPHPHQRRQSAHTRGRSPRRQPCRPTRTLPSSLTRPASNRATQSPGRL